MKLIRRNWEWRRNRCAWVKRGNRGLNNKKNGMKCIRNGEGMWMWGGAEWRRTSGSWQEGTVFSLSPTHWPSDAAELTAPDYRAMAAGEGGRGINWDFREEKTGRLTKWGKREWGITALVMAAWAGAWNNLRHSPVHVYVHGCVSACCGCDIQTCTMKEMKGYEGVNTMWESCTLNQRCSQTNACKALFFFNMPCEKLHWNVRSRCS